ncbi:MAG: Gfo/Idh/MocA family oxidoreductase, partial [Candidatus Solibacter sp.]|nr:Gfo/Idh/MocA family oxidoreductase [Candidatus Solibacter sp.]
MPYLIDRRTFLAAPFFVRHLISAPPSGTLRLGAFGAGGMAYVTLEQLARHPKVKLVCVAEVDSAQLKQLKAKYPDVRVYQDWRQMLATEKRNLDAACVGTPDHMHAPMAMSAMRLGLHVYQQKPMAHSIHEVHMLTAMARKKKLVTQMGIQIHSAREYKIAVQLIQGGAIGKIREVHSWSEKKWGDTDPLPQRTDPVPDTLNWDHWIGVAQPRPFIRGVYHPENWRKRIDFGTATFGDMGCHILDPVFGALGLAAPLSVRSEGVAPNGQSWALHSVIHYVFPGTSVTEGKTVPITWYDGDARPPQEIQALAGSRRLPGQGS